MRDIPAKSVLPVGNQVCKFTLSPTVDHDAWFRMHDIQTSTKLRELHIPVVCGTIKFTYHPLETFHDSLS